MIEGQTSVRSARFGAGAFNQVGPELGRLLVTTMKAPWRLAEPRLGAKSAAVLFVENMEIETLERQLNTAPEADTVLAIGGGQAIDLGKFIAWKHGLRLVSVPTILSVDTFVTPAAGIRRGHQVEHVEQTSPDPLVIDYDLGVGPVPFRPYSPFWVHWNWRGWMPFGTSTVGDWFRHVIDMKSDAQVEDLCRSIRKLRPECVVNSRIKTCSFPGRIPPPYCDCITSGDNEILDKAIGFEWENPGSMNTSYGYNQNDHNWVDAKEIVFRLVDIVSKRGNYLLNLGPTSEGLIPPPCVDRLMEVGAWMETNGEAIYGTSPWRGFRDEAPDDQTAKAPEESAVDIRFTAKGNSVYAIRLNWPDREVPVRALRRGGVSGRRITGASILGSTDQVKWRQTDDALILSVPREKPCRYAFIYRIDHKEE